MCQRMAFKYFSNEYTDAQNTGNLDAIVAYATPCFVVKEGQVLRHDDLTAKRKYFAQLLASNQQHGRTPGVSAIST